MRQVLGSSPSVPMQLLFMCVGGRMDVSRKDCYDT